MNSPTLFDQIIMKLRTTSEVSNVIHCLEEFSTTSFSEASAPAHVEIFRKLPKETADMLITTFIKQSIKAEDQILIKKEINELLDKLRTCKSIKLTIAFQPGENTITLFSDWIKKNVKPDLLIDLQFDKSIVGGAQIIAKGVYKDYSIRKNLTNRFQIQRDEIMELLK
jgi:F0F1-type ATP synthase delta subunit